MEPPSSGAPADAAVAKAGGLPAKAASPRPAQKRAAEDAAASGRPRAERPLPALTDQPHAKRRRLDLSRERSDVCNVCTCRRFLKKLWDIVESELFSSVWWSDNGRSVVIHEEKFKEEVLSRRCCMKIFHSESMESFSWQLHLYGFTKEPQDLPRSGSLDDSAFAASAGEVRGLLYMPAKPQRSLAGQPCVPVKQAFTAQEIRTAEQILTAVGFSAHVQEV